MESLAPLIAASINAGTPLLLVVFAPRGILGLVEKFTQRKNKVEAGHE